MGRPKIGPAFDFKLPDDLRAGLEEIVAYEGVPLAEALRDAARLGVAHKRIERMKAAARAGGRA